MHERGDWGYYLKTSEKSDDLERFTPGFHQYLFDKSPFRGKHFLKELVFPNL